MKGLGIFAVCAGAALALYGLTMDTSVPTMFGRVSNIGLLERAAGFRNAGLAILVVGVLLIGFGSGKGDDKEDDLKALKLRFQGTRDLQLGEYQLYLTKKYRIEKNATLEKYVIGDQLFGALEDALTHAHNKDLEAEAEIQKEIERRAQLDNDSDELLKTINNKYSGRGY